MKKVRSILLLLFWATSLLNAQNILQNPGFENLPTWDSLWFISFTVPSSPTAVATEITTDSHEGVKCVQLSNTVNTKWTYYYSDSLNAPLTFAAHKSYEVKGWMKSVEEAKKATFSIFWNGSFNEQIIYSGNPDPVSNPDWFMVKDTITPVADYSDGYLLLGLRATKDAFNNGAGKLLFDDFSVVRIPDNTETEIIGFSMPEQAIPAVINSSSDSILIEVPYGTDITSLAPDMITLSRGAVVSPAAGEIRDFTLPVVYTVTAQDETTSRDWIVSVSIQPNTGTRITGFSIVGQTDTTLIDTIAYTVDLEVAYGTDLKAIIPAITLSYGATIIPSGGVANDFTNDVIYTVTAEDGFTVQAWTVSVGVVPPNSENDITAFSFAEQTGSERIDTALHTVDIDVPFGTVVSALVPAVSVSSGATINPASGAPADFSSPVTYTVTAQDGVSLQEWTVAVTILPNTENDITAFSFAEQTGPAAIDTDQHTVNIEVAKGTDVTILVPTIEISEGAVIDPVSDLSTDFTNDVTYTVTAQDGVSSQEWIITVTTDPAVSVDKSSTKRLFKIYPNPAVDQLNVEMAVKSNIWLIDITGGMILSLTDIQGKIVIPVSEFDNGIYFLKVNSNGIIQSQKIIINR